MKATTSPVSILQELFWFDDLCNGFTGQQRFVKQRFNVLTSEEISLLTDFSLAFNERSARLNPLHYNLNYLPQ